MMLRRWGIVDPRDGFVYERCFTRSGAERALRWANFLGGIAGYRPMKAVVARIDGKKPL